MRCIDIDCEKDAGIFIELYSFVLQTTLAHYSLARTKLPYDNLVPHYLFWWLLAKKNYYIIQSLSN